MIDVVMCSFLELLGVFDAVNVAFVFCLPVVFVFVFASCVCFGVCQLCLFWGLLCVFDAFFRRNCCRASQVLFVDVGLLEFVSMFVCLFGNECERACLGHYCLDVALFLVELRVSIMLPRVI